MKWHDKEWFCQSECGTCRFHMILCVHVAKIQMPKMWNKNLAWWLFFFFSPLKIWILAWLGGERNHEIVTTNLSLRIRISPTWYVDQMGLVFVALLSPLGANSKVICHNINVHAFVYVYLDKWDFRNLFFL